MSISGYAQQVLIVDEERLKVQETEGRIDYHSKSPKKSWRPRLGDWPRKERSHLHNCKERREEIRPRMQENV